MPLAQATAYKMDVWWAFVFIMITTTAAVTNSSTPAPTPYPADSINKNYRTVGAYSCLLTITLTAIYTYRVGTDAVSFGSDFNHWNLLRVGYPVYFLVYFLTITLAPTFFGPALGDSCPTTVIQPEADAFAGFIIFAGVCLDFLFARTVNFKTVRLPVLPTFRNIRHFNLDSWVTLLLTGAVAKIDTYTDVCFVVIAHGCGDSLWFPAFVLMSIAIFLTQLAPMLYGSYLTTTKYDSEGGSMYGAGMFRFGDFHCMAALAKRDNPDTMLRVYHYTPIGRFCLEDIGQTAIQIMFLTKHATNNPTVLASVVVGIVGSTAAAMSSIREMGLCSCCTDALEEGLHGKVVEVDSRTVSTKAFDLRLSEKRQKRAVIAEEENRRLEERHAKELKISQKIQKKERRAKRASLGGEGEGVADSSSAGRGLRQKTTIVPVCGV